MGDEAGTSIPSAAQPGVFHHCAASVCTGNGQNGQDLGDVLLCIDGVKAVQFTHSAEIEVCFLKSLNNQFLFMMVECIVISFLCCDQVSRDYGYALRPDFALLLLQGVDAVPTELIPNFYVRSIQLDRNAATYQVGRLCRFPRAIMTITCADSALDVQTIKDKARLSLCSIPKTDVVSFDTSKSLPQGCSIKSGAIDGGFDKGGAMFGRYVRTLISGVRDVCCFLKTGFVFRAPCASKTRWRPMTIDC